MRRFARMWPEWEKVPSVMAQITWTAHRLLLDRFSEDSNIYAWYAAKSVANRWSVRQLQAQIHLRLHERQGAAVSNFAEVLGHQTRRRCSKRPMTLMSSISWSWPRTPRSATSNRP